ncbi:hypothetical protein PPSIR1_16580 [Plesiocystis pacifica SIR-1]|uniref:Secreted protein n=1 Tax=Plesiocystis pacifica SIR-1 TaxID=391625 RepID=A6G371_9BACT|nr:hypothetical protein [Plesiocystis pacifica]EDM79696.1 hypothetical protein PPSIR1_16580 [Plesiocystis pacifica SIR-1]
MRRLGTKRSHTLLRAACVLALGLGLGACSDEGGGEDEAGESGGEVGESASLAITTDAASLCTDGVEGLEIVTRRVDCFDPPLPCTAPANPPWVTGTSRTCAELSGAQEWSVTVAQTGRWETRLRPTAGGSEDAGACLAVSGMTNTPVAKADLESTAVITLEPETAACTLTGTL